MAALLVLVFIPQLGDRWQEVFSLFVVITLTTRALSASRR